ncbi:MAG: hypothetical protein ABI644_08005 [Arenimonas sp.]
MTALLTKGWIKIAQAKGIHDQPERRRLHQAFIPRAGGISIALVMVLVSMLIYSSSSDINNYWVLIITGIVLFSVLGFLDDLIPIPSGRKLFLHLFAASIIFLVCMFYLSMSLLVAAVIAFAYLLFVNIWNFMDGSNGMIGMQSLLFVIGFLALSRFTNESYYYALALAATCLGFLPFNFPVARVFLGDAGSHVLGAAVVGLAFFAYFENQCSVMEILCLLSALWIDAVLTLIRRGVLGYKLMQAHRSHLYQYLIRNGQSHAAVCSYYSAWTIFVILVIGFGRQVSEMSQRILLSAVILMAFALHQSLRLFVLKSGNGSKKKNLKS